MRIFALLLCVATSIGCGEVAATIIDAAPDGTSIDSGVDVDAAVDAAVICAGLDALSCRAAAGCVADFCDSCTCTPTYAGCRDAADPMAQCPILDCPTPSCCHDDGDCTNISCVTPDDPPTCGICQPVTSQCATDQQCQSLAAGIGAVPICEPIPCACSPANQCVPGCAVDADCDEAETCDVARGRCGAQACSVATPCPANFDCTAGSCARRSCTTDATCDGFCVEGACRAGLGVCTPPAG